MDCIYLEESGEGFLCGASITGMAPGLEEREFYCNREEHENCPILLARALREWHNTISAP